MIEEFEGKVKVPTGDIFRPFKVGRGETGLIAFADGWEAGAGSIWTTGGGVCGVIIGNFGTDNSKEV